MLSAGTRLGPYEVLTALGAGGMGEVYRARDTRLDRTVAIKVLPPHLAEDAEFRERFEREAKTVAALEHPHICPVYDVGEAPLTNPESLAPNPVSVSFLVMPLLEGESLAARLTKGPLPIDRAIACAIQIADALAAAHRHGIVHRDLKPGNVMLTKSGAKLLDFGLAKAGPSKLGPYGADLGAQSPRVGAELARPNSMLATQAPLTAKGTILGTFHYMAPEQIEGEAADARSDLFAFGAVLYEMLTARLAFDGKTQASVMTAVMATHPPSLAESRPDVPPFLDHLVARCLAKDPDERWQSALDVMNELKWASQHASLVSRSGSSNVVRSDAGVGRSFSSGGTLPWAVAAVLLLTTIAFAWLAFRPAAPADARSPIPFTISPPEGTVFAGGSGAAPWPAISPDGNQLAFVAVEAGSSRQMLWVRPLETLAARPLAATNSAYQPFWSPDSRSIAFFADGKLKRIDLAGGSPKTICDVPGNPRKGAWGRDNVILFAQAGQPIHRVPADGGVPAPVTSLDTAQNENGHVYPQFLADGRHFLYVGSSASAEQSGVYVASLDSPQRTRLLTGLGEAQYAEPGYLLFVREGTLYAQPFDVSRLVLSGEPVTVVESVSFTTVSGIAAFSVSNAGVLAYRPGSPALTRLVWRDRTGRSLGTIGEISSYISLELSPDERHVAVSRYEGAGSDVWLIDIARGLATRLTTSPGFEMDPTWSPDGTRLVFASNRTGPGFFELFQRETNSATPETRVSAHAVFPRAWSPDGRFVIGSTRTGQLVRAPIGGPGEPEVLLRLKEVPAFDTEMSPDRAWVSYTSFESGRAEIFIQRLPPGDGRWQISSGGSMSRWRHDMRELFYQSSDQKLTSVSLDLTTPSPKIGTPTALFATRTFTTGGLAFGSRQQYAVTRDGQRFLLNEAASGAQAEVAIVLNWDARLKRP